MRVGCQEGCSRVLRYLWLPVSSYILVIINTARPHSTASDNTKQFADLLAQHGKYKVVMPDFFRHEPFQAEWLGQRDLLMAWVGKYGSLEVASIDII